MRDLPSTTEDAEAEIGARAVDAAVPVFSSWSDDIAKIVSRSGSAEAAASALAAWAQKAAKNEAVQRSIYEAALIANMSAQLHVRLVEVPESAKGVALSRFALAADGSLPPGDGPRISFSALPFDEAVEAFLSRQLVSPETWAQMDAAARQRAFAAAGLASEALQREAYDGILAALQQGTTLRDFAAELRSGARTLGVSEADPSYVETLFRTTIASAYGAGRLEQMQSPAVTMARPFVQLRAILDARTTSICRYLNGLTFDRRTDPGYAKYLPPNHYSCRTGSVLLAQASPSLLIRSEDVDARGQPQPPFDSKPTLALENGGQTAQSNPVSDSSRGEAAAQSRSERRSPADPVVGWSRGGSRDTFTKNVDGHTLTVSKTPDGEWAYYIDGTLAGTRDQRNWAQLAVYRAIGYDT